jgi:hypothetical protein
METRQEVLVVEFSVEVGFIMKLLDQCLIAAPQDSARYIYI